MNPFFDPYFEGLSQVPRGTPALPAPEQFRRPRQRLPVPQAYPSSAPPERGPLLGPSGNLDTDSASARELAYVMNPNIPGYVGGGGPAGMGAHFANGQNERTADWAANRNWRQDGVVERSPSAGVLRAMDPNSGTAPTIDFAEIVRKAKLLKAANNMYGDTSEKLDIAVPKPYYPNWQESSHGDSVMQPDYLKYFSGLGGYDG